MQPPTGPKPDGTFDVVVAPLGLTMLRARYAKEEAS